MRFFDAKSAPDADHSAALQHAIDTSPGIVHLSAGIYRVSGVQIPANVTLQGEGAATVIRPAIADHPAVFMQENTGDWTLRDVVFEGGAPAGTWQTRDNLGQTAINITRIAGAIKSSASSCVTSSVRA